MRQNLAKTIDEIWGANESDANFVANNFAAAVQNLRDREKALARPSSLDGRAKAGAAAATSTVEFDRSGAIADVVCAVEPGFAIRSF